MANFSRKKLQVFVSSTHDDLVKERQAAVEAILTAGHIPAGMELFTAGDESQMEVIKQWIDESDVYLLILGGRYGSIESNTGKSYTQLEYEYAISKGIPFFACVINDAAIEARTKTSGRSVLEMDNPQKLREFRGTVLSKLCKFWDDFKDIKIAIAETLAHFSTRDNLIGWVRPNTQSNLPAIADEITRLSKENAELRSQITHAQFGPLINGMSFDDLKALLESKNLLNHFEVNARDLAEGNYTRNDESSRELRGIGLIIGSSWGHKLSEDGRIFMNKLAMFRLKSKVPSAAG